MDNDHRENSVEESSRRLLARYAGGESTAARELYDRHISQLMNLVRRRISAKLQARVDCEDVVQSAMRSFFVQARNEAYLLQRAGDLWRLLATITLSKLRRQIEVHTAAKRSIGKEVPAIGAPDHHPLFIDRQPLPNEEVALLDEVQHVMQTCSAAEREVLQLRLAGETIENIAESLQRSQRTVRRLLQSSREALERRLLAEELP